MRAETTIRAVDAIAKATLSGKRINGLFRLLGNPDVLWKQAYANLYSNKGAMTKGVNNNTLDGFSEERVNHLIRRLYAKEYRFTSARRSYIRKENGKMRPLGIPTGNDKLVQEVSEYCWNKSMSLFSRKTLMGFVQKKAVTRPCNRQRLTGRV